MADKDVIKVQVDTEFGKTEGIDKVGKQLEKTLTNARKRAFKQQKSEEKKYRKSSRTEEDSGNGNRSKIGGMQKLLNTFKRVGFYRIARRVFSFIEQGFARGINSLVQFDDQANKTMSGMATAWEKINASIALVTEPLLESLLPMVTGISDSFTEFANGISMASASMRGLSEYTKISDDYMKDLQNTGKQLNFDKFTSLNMENGPFETAKITDEDQEKLNKYTSGLQKFRDTIDNIKTVLSPIVDIIKKIFDYLADNPDSILTAVKVLLAMGLIKFITSLTGGLNKISTPLALFIGAFVLFDSVLKNAPQWLKWLTMIASGILMIAVAVGLATGNIAKAVAIPTLAITAGITVASLANIVAPEKFAGGGIAEKGQLFIANERGPELITPAGGGRVAINNEDQVEEAVYRAGIRLASEGYFSNSTGLVLNLDGAEVARSRRFTEEMNRRNAGLNLR